MVTRRGLFARAAAAGAMGGAASLLQVACTPGGSGTGGSGAPLQSTGPAKISYLRYYNQPDRVAGEQAIF